MTEKNSEFIKKWIYALISVAIGLLIALATPPVGLTIEAMRFVGIFVTMLLVMSFRVIPEFLAPLLALVACVIFGVAPFKDVFGAWVADPIWTTVVVFAFAYGLTKSGLITRIAFLVLRLFPETFKGQILALMSTATVMGPLIPNGTAKVAILGPFAATLAKASGFVKGSKGVAGMFSAMLIPSQILSVAFLTGSPATFMILGIMPEEFRARFSWVGWLTATSVWLVVGLVLTYFFVSKYYNPGSSFVVPENFIQKKLNDLGPMTKDEKVAALVLAIAFLSLITQSLHGVSNFAILAIAFGVLMIYGLLTPSDFQTKLPWPLIFMVGFVLCLGGLINITGLQAWMGKTIAHIVSPYITNAYTLVFTVCVGTYLLRYFVVSMTAFIPLSYAIFSGLASVLGVEPMVVMFLGYVSANVWNLSFHNVVILQGQSLMEDLPTWKSILPSSYAFMVINVIAALASVPLWQALGMIK